VGGGSVWRVECGVWDVGGGRWAVGGGRWAVRGGRWVVGVRAGGGGMRWWGGAGLRGKSRVGLVAHQAGLTLAARLDERRFEPLALGHR
jgi:hypothetical protein